MTSLNRTGSSIHFFNASIAPRCRASPLENTSLIERPLRGYRPSLRPYRFSSLTLPASENAPELRTFCRRNLASSPLAGSASQRGGLNSGASMSTILLFIRTRQNVSPSIKEQRSLPKMGNVSVRMSGCNAITATYANRSQHALRREKSSPIPSAASLRFRRGISQVCDLASNDDTSP